MARVFEAARTGQVDFDSPIPHPELGSAFEMMEPAVAPVTSQRHFTPSPAESTEPR